MPVMKRLRIGSVDYDTVGSASVTQTLTSGTEIATVTIDGTATKLYAPSGGGGGASILTLYANGGMNTLYIDAGLTTELMDYYGYDKEAAYEDLSSFDIVKVVNLINGNQKTCVVSCIDWDSVEEELVLSIVVKTAIRTFSY